MKRHMRLAAFLLALTALFISQCSNPGGGNSSDIGNPTITGKLYYVDKSPAKNAAVRLSRFTPTLADTNHVNLVTTFTDNNGVFAIDSIDTGTYIIEASDNRNNLALIDSIPVTDPAATVFLPADTLKPAGAIKGVINLVEGGDPRKVFVLMFGLDRFARVEADGSFRFNNLAEAKYDLRLIPSLNDYGILDTFDIPVVSAKTTDLDTITLPFTGIPTPKNVSIAYDTLKQIVTLRWDSLSTPLVRGYNVYRRNTDSAMVGMINPAPISDTVYRDSTGVQDQTYEYYVVAVDTSSHESKMSPKVVRKIVSAFTFIRTIGSKGTGPGKFTNPMNVSVSKSGVVLISDYTSPMAEFPDGKILFFDTTGLFKREIDSIGNPVFAQSGTLSDKIYVCEAFPASSISIIDTAGIRSNSIQLSPTSIAASPFDDHFIVSTLTNEIVVLDTINVAKDTISIPSLLSVTFLDSSVMLVLQKQSDPMVSSLVSVRDYSGNETSNWELGEFVSMIAATPNKNVAAFEDHNPGKIYFYSSNGIYLGSFGSFIEPKGLAFDALGRIYVADKGAGTVSVHQLPAGF